MLDTARSIGSATHLAYIFFKGGHLSPVPVVLLKPRCNRVDGAALREFESDCGSRSRSRDAKVLGRVLDAQMIVGRHLDVFTSLSVRIPPDDPKVVRNLPENAGSVRNPPENPAVSGVSPEKSPLGREPALEGTGPRGCRPGMSQPGRSQLGGARPRKCAPGREPAQAKTILGVGRARWRLASSVPSPSPVITERLPTD